MSVRRCHHGDCAAEASHEIVAVWEYRQQDYGLDIVTVIADTCEWDAPSMLSAARSGSDAFWRLSDRPEGVRRYRPIGIHVQEIEYVGRQM